MKACHACATHISRRWFPLTYVRDAWMCWFCAVGCVVYRRYPLARCRVW